MSIRSIPGVKPNPMITGVNDPQLDPLVVKRNGLDPNATTFARTGGTASLPGQPPMPGGAVGMDARLADVGLSLNTNDPAVMQGLQALFKEFGLSFDPKQSLQANLGKLGDAIQGTDPLGLMRELGLDPGQSLTDPKSVDAIKQVQEAAGMIPTGQMDLETLLALVQAKQDRDNAQRAQASMSSPSPSSSASGAGGAGGLSSVPRRSAPGPMGGASSESPGASSSAPTTAASSAPGASPSGKNLTANQREAYEAALKGDPAHGVPPLSPTAAKALVANMTGESLSDPSNNHWDVHHMSQGIVQWDPSRSAAIKAEFGKEPKDMSVAEQTHAALWEINHNSRFAATKSALYSGSSPQQMMTELVRNYEAPANPSAEIAKRLGFFNSIAVA